jgi:ferredoxin-nitrite reductase
MANSVEDWKAAKHGFDVWPDVLRYAEAKTPMSQIDDADLERMKWHGFYYRKRDEPGRYMNRIRITGNELTAAQAREVAHLAYEYGHGIVDVTTRANLQVQGLDVDSLPKVAERLAKAGLTSKQTGHDNIRNVFCHPRSGIDPDEIIDCRPLCRAIDEVFLDSRIYSDLPRKFNIALNGADRHAALYWTQDVSFLATYDIDHEPAFHLLVGGTQGQSTHLGWNVPVLVKPYQVADVSRVLLDLFRAKGNREKRGASRFKYVVEHIGVEGVLDWLEESLPYRLLPSVDEPSPATSYEDEVGWFRQADPKLWSMGLSVPLGRLSWRQLEGVAVLAKRWGSGRLRTSAEQGLSVIDVPTGFKDAAATDAAALGLAVSADTIAKNTVACTGQQFCNIAVTETKGHMLQLMDRLRRRGVVLQGIRIHMSGCPSSCAGHFTADIGLKGVRVRRLLGTREGFDVMLGGGIAGQVHLGMQYKLGVDVDQLPNLIEEVVSEYYLKHRSGQTFSAYWREKLQHLQAQKVGEHDLTPPIWECDKCQYRHAGVDPPAFCPSCAGLRRYFARVETDAAADESPQSAEASEKPAADIASSSTTPAPIDGHVYVAELDSLKDGAGIEATVGDKVLALFRNGHAVHAVDNACPHEGAPLAEGELADGCIICPWHAWAFDACSGCSIEPKGHQVESYSVKIVDGRVYVALGPAALPADQTPAPAASAAPKRAVETLRTIVDVIDETHDVKTFRLDNSDGAIPFDLPGKFLRVCLDVDGAPTWRSFTVSSSPSQPDRIDLTIKLNPTGEISRRLFELTPGAAIRVKGAQGGFCFDPAKHDEPLVLASAGSGVTPMMSIARYLADRGWARSCTFLHGARERRDILFDAECQSLAGREPSFKYVVTLSRPGADWTGESGRLSFDSIAAHAPHFAASRFFLCGPNEFMDALKADLLAAGVAEDRIHTEQFHAAPQPKLEYVG